MTPTSDLHKLLSSKNSRDVEHACEAMFAEQSRTTFENELEFSYTRQVAWSAMNLQESPHTQVASWVGKLSSGSRRLAILSAALFFLLPPLCLLWQRDFLNQHLAPVAWWLLFTATCLVATFAWGGAIAVVLQSYAPSTPSTAVDGVLRIGRVALRPAAASCLVLLMGLPAGLAPFGLWLTYWSSKHSRVSAPHDSAPTSTSPYSPGNFVKKIIEDGEVTIHVSYEAEATSMQVDSLISGNALSNSRASLELGAAYVLKDDYAGALSVYKTIISSGDDAVVRLAQENCMAIGALCAVKDDRTLKRPVRAVVRAAKK